jgi:hypothetical protein
MTLIQKDRKSIPRELAAVIHIFSADEELKEKTLSHVDIESQTINWFGISRKNFGSGHTAAILWAKSIWTLTFPTNTELMENSTSMDMNIRKSVLEALHIAWGV